MTDSFQFPVLDEVKANFLDAPLLAIEDLKYMETEDRVSIIGSFTSVSIS